MIRSMTGFGQGRGHAGGESISVEIRSVNGKFCDVKPHLPRELGSLESDLVKTIKARVQRGVLDVHVRRDGDGQRTTQPRLDLALAAAYASALRELKMRLMLSGEPSVGDIAGFEGVVALVESPPDLGAAAIAIRQALDQALNNHDELRRTEGQALAKDLSARLDAVEKGAVAIRELAPLSVEGLRDRLAARVTELSRGTTVDPGRLAQEVAFLADRTDVTEELTRLASHLQQMRALLTMPAPVGRKLDFLLQEANREVNTVGSKAQHAGIGAHVVELKAELERIREQVQNVE